MLFNLNDDIHCSFYIADQDMAQYNLCSAGENYGSWAELLKCTTDNLFSSHVFLLNLLLKYKFTSETGGFESYDSHQLLCGGMVEGNSEPFHIAWFRRRLCIHPGLFGGLKTVQFDWLLAKNQSGVCRFDPCFLKATVGCVFIKWLAFLSSIETSR